MTTMPRRSPEHRRLADGRGDEQGRRPDACPRLTNERAMANGQMRSQMRKSLITDPAPSLLRLLRESSFDSIENFIWGLWHRVRPAHTCSRARAWGASFNQNIGDWEGSVDNGAADAAARARGWWRGPHVLEVRRRMFADERLANGGTSQSGGAPARRRHLPTCTRSPARPSSNGDESLAEERASAAEATYGRLSSLEG